MPCRLHDTNGRGSLLCAARVQRAEGEPATFFRFEEMIFEGHCCARDE